jgi:hypothetical protein
LVVLPWIRTTKVRLSVWARSKTPFSALSRYPKAVGSRALIVHAIDQNAMAFYFKYGFIEFPNGSQTLFLLIETIALGVS